MAPRRAARSASRKTTPVSPPKQAPPPILSDASNPSRPATSHGDASGEPRPAHCIVHDPNRNPSLPPVNEGAEPASDGADRVDEDDAHRARLISADSTSEDDFLEDLADLDRDAIIENLTPLYDDAVAVLAMFRGLNHQALAALYGRVQDPGSAQHRRFEMRRKRFSISREPYGNHDYISPTLMVCKLAGTADVDELNEGVWRPDPVFHLANVAAQAIALFMPPAAEDRLTLLQYLFNNFSTPFVGQQLCPLGPTLMKDTVGVIVELYTQYFIRRAELDADRPDVDLDELAQIVFLDHQAQAEEFPTLARPLQKQAVQRLAQIRPYVTADPGSAVDPDALRAAFPWPQFVAQLTTWSSSRAVELEAMVDGKGGIQQLADIIASAALSNTQEAGQRVPSNPPPDDVHADSLDAPLDDVPDDPPDVVDPVTHPAIGNDLQAFATQWKQLSARVQRHDPGVDVAEVSDPEVPASPTPAASDRREGHVAAVLDGPLIEIRADRPPTRRQEREPRSPSTAPSHSGRDLDSPIPPTKQTLLVLETLRRQQQEREKENTRMRPKRSLLDRQPDAERVEWSDPPEEDPSPRLTKRPRHEVVEDEADEDGGEAEQEADGDDFETNLRLAKGQRPTPEQPVRTADSPTRQSVGAAPDIRAVPGQASQRGPATLLQPRKSPGPGPGRRQGSQLPATRPKARSTSAQPGPSTSSQPTARRAVITEARPPPSTAPVATRPFAVPRRPASPLSLERVHEEAKRATQMFRVLHEPLSHARRAYTAEETRRLVEMIAVYGTRWAEILVADSKHPAGPLLQSRTQVQLKDKARNIKIDFLKARHRLPERFETVSIGARQVEILRQQGIVEAENRFLGDVDDRQELYQRQR